MSESQSLPGGMTACPSCGTEVDLTGAPDASVACPVCGADVPVAGPDPVASDDLEIGEVLRDFVARGYEQRMEVAAGDRVTCGACGSQAAAEDLQVDDVRRVRDSRTDDDTVAAVAMTCPNCRALGHLVLDYGADGDAEHGRLLDRFEWGHIPS